MITDIQRHNAKVTGVHTSQGERIACNHLVIANGAWAAGCSEWLHFPIPIIPQRGQALMLHQPPTPLRHIIFGEAAYLTPKMKHKIIVGATKEEVGFDTNTTSGGLSWLLNAAIRLCSSTRKLHIRSHVGRVYVPGHPIINQYWEQRQAGRTSRLPSAMEVSASCSAQSQVKRLPN